MRTLGIWMLLAATTLAQQQTPTFRSGVSLVTIDVTVLDADGRPVPGLTADDFVVKFDGIVQPVRAVAFVQSSAALGAGSGAPTPVGRALPTDTRVGEPRVFVVLADDVSFTPSRGQKLFAAAERFVMRLPSTDLVGFTTTSGAQTINPSPDRLAVAQALSKVTGELMDVRVMIPGDPSVGIAEALEIDQGDTTRLRQVIARECFGGQQTQVDSQSLELLLRDNDCAVDVRSGARRIAVQARLNTTRQIDRFLSVVNSMRGVPGIKHLIILSDGLGIVRDFQDLIPIARAASTAGVQMSVLVEETDLEMGDSGRETGLSRVDAGQAAQRRSDARAMFSGLQTMADTAGGGFYKVIGSPEPTFQRVALASSAVYRIGVEPRGGTVPGREFAVVASVKRPGVTVLASRHTVAPDPNAPPTNPVSSSTTRPVSTEELLRVALGAKELRRDVPIRIGTARRRATSSGDLVDVAIDIEVPGNVAGPLSGMFADITGPDSVRGGRIDLPAPTEGGTYRAMVVLGLASGSHRIRVAVADATGAVGTVETPVIESLDVVGPFTASDLLISWIDAGKRSQFVALDEIPAGAQAIVAALELYPTAQTPSGADVRVLMTLTPADQRLPPVERDVPVEVADRTLRATAEFTAAEMPAGEHSLRASVFVNGKPVGAKRLTLRRK